MKDAHTKKVYRTREELVEESVAWKARAVKSQKTFLRERDEALSQVMLRNTGRDSANAQYHEMLAALLYIVNPQE